MSLKQHAAGLQHKTRAACWHYWHPLRPPPSLPPRLRLRVRSHDEHAFALCACELGACTLVHWPCSNDTWLGCIYSDENIRVHMHTCARRSALLLPFFVLSEQQGASIASRCIAAACVLPCMPACMYASTAQHVVIYFTTYTPSRMETVVLPGAWPAGAVTCPAAVDAVQWHSGTVA